ncbi:MAG: DUF6364 family protein [Fibrobacterota bacterium]
MNAKLTLKLNGHSIRQAKRYARTHQDSLSGLVEKFFDSLTGPRQKGEIKNSPLVESLAGILKKGHADPRGDYADYLTRKYQ